MQSCTLVTLAVFLFATVVLCNAEYRYKFRPPRPPAPTNYKKWTQMAQHRSYRKPSVYRFAPPPPLPPKRPPIYRRPYNTSPQLHFAKPIWQPKAIFPNPYQQIPISFKEQQAFKTQQYFKDPLLKEPLILKNPQLFEEQFAKPHPSLSSFPHTHTLNAHLHLLQVPQHQVHHQLVPQVHHQVLPQMPHTNTVILKSPLHLDAEREGPIRTIPAPNLSGAHYLKPTGMLLHPIGNVYQQYAQPAQTSVSQPRPLVIPQYHVTEEPSNDIRVKNTLTGAQKLYAPDPDPRLPAPPVNLATDPFSMPSNGKPLPLDVPRYHSSQQQTSSSKGLTTQEFYDLLNSFPLPHAQDSIYQSSNQPQLHQHLMQQAHGLPIPTIDSALAYIQQPASTASFQQNPYVSGTDYLAQQTHFQPQYQTFNYQEQSPSSAPGQFYAKDQTSYPQNDDYEYQSQASQKIPSILPLAEPERENELNNADILLHHSNQHAIEQLINQEPSEPATSSNANVKMDNAFSRNYYTTLPNRQAAETLATLQAAGSINNNLMNILRKKQQEARLNSEKNVTSTVQNNDPSPTPSNDSTMRIFVPDYNDSYEDGEIITAPNQNGGNDEFRNSQEQTSSEEHNPTTKAESLESATSKITESTIVYGKNNRKS